MTPELPGRDSGYGGDVSVSGQYGTPCDTRQAQDNLRSTRVLYTLHRRVFIHQRAKPLAIPVVTKDYPSPLKIELFSAVSIGR